MFLPFNPGSGLSAIKNGQTDIFKSGVLGLIMNTKYELKLHISSVEFLKNTFIILLWTKTD